MKFSYLFDPLDFGEHKWTLDGNGVVHPVFLALNARDMAKFGLLFLNQGDFSGRRLVSSEWVTESTSIFTNLSVPVWGYEFGYQWWSWELAGINGFSAVGLFDRQIMVIAELQMVIVAQCDHPLSFDWSSLYTQELVEDYILPAILS